MLVSGQIHQHVSLADSRLRFTAGVIHLCKSLAFEFREFARVNIVSPGWVHTKMGALGEEQVRFYFCLCRLYGTQIRGTNPLT